MLRTVILFWECRDCRIFHSNPSKGWQFGKEHSQIYSEKKDVSQFAFWVVLGEPWKFVEFTLFWGRNAYLLNLPLATVRWRNAAGDRIRHWRCRSARNVDSRGAIEVTRKELRKIEAKGSKERSGGSCGCHPGRWRYGKPNQCAPRILRQTAFLHRFFFCRLRALGFFVSKWCLLFLWLCADKRKCANRRYSSLSRRYPAYGHRLRTIKWCHSGNHPKAWIVKTEVIVREAEPLQKNQFSGASENLKLAVCSAEAITLNAIFLERYIRYTKWKSPPRACWNASNRSLRAGSTLENVPGRIVESFDHVG